MVTTSAVAPDAFPMKLFSLKPITMNAYMNFSKKKKKKKPINEGIEAVKFFYKNWHNDKFPVVKCLDYEYPGQPHQKTYGQRKDLLGWNVNYFENKEDAVRTIDDIDTFARMLSANKQEKYKRIKYFFPEQASYIRRYNRDFIRGLKRKDGWYWTKTDFEEMKQREKDFS